RPSGSEGRRPVKYSQSTARLRVNSADAPANMNRIVSALPQIFRTIESFAVKYIDYNLNACLPIAICSVAIIVKLIIKSTLKCKVNKLKPKLQLILILATPRGRRDSLW